MLLYIKTYLIKNTGAKNLDIEYLNKASHQEEREDKKTGKR